MNHPLDGSYFSHSVRAVFFTFINLVNVQATALILAGVVVKQKKAHYLVRRFQNLITIPTPMLNLQMGLCHIL